MGSLKSCSTPLRTRHNQERKSWHRMGLEPSLRLLHVNFLVAPNIVLSIAGLIFFFFNWDFYQDESFIRTVQVQKECALGCPWVSVWVVLLTQRIGSSCVPQFLLPT